MKTIIKSLIAAVAITNSAVLVPMTMSEQPNAAVREQEQQLDLNELEIYWKKQGSLLELGRIPAYVVAEISSVIKRKMEDTQFNQEERYKLIFSEKEDNKETIDLFIKLLQARMQNQCGTVRQVASGAQQQITAPGTSAYHALLSAAPVQEPQLTVAELIAQKQHLIIDLVDILEGYEISCFNQEISDVLVPMLADSRNESECPLESDYQTIAAKRIAANSPYDHIVIQDPVLKERGHEMYISPNCQLVAIDDHDTNAVGSAKFSPDGKYVVTVFKARDKTAKIVEVSSGQEIATISHNGRIMSAAFSPDGKYVVTASWDKTAKIVEVSSGQEIAAIRHDHAARSAIFSPDGKYVLTASGVDLVKIVEVSSGKEIKKIGARSAIFSPDGKYVVTVSYAHSARIVEVSSGNEIAIIRHGSYVYSAVFSPDGKYVVTASDDKTAKIVEVSSGQEIATIRHEDIVRSAAFSPDGKYVVTASGRSSRVTPLGLDGMEPEKVLAIAALVHTALDARKNNQQLTVPLDENSWIFKAFMTLSVQERNRLQEQFPEIEAMIARASDSE